MITLPDSDLESFAVRLAARPQFKKQVRFVFEQAIERSDFGPLTAALTKSITYRSIARNWAKELHAAASDENGKPRFMYWRLISFQRQVRRCAAVELYNRAPNLSTRRHDKSGLQLAAAEKALMTGHYTGRI